LYPLSICVGEEEKTKGWFWPSIKKEERKSVMNGGTENDFA